TSILALGCGAAPTPVRQNPTGGEAALPQQFLPTGDSSMGMEQTVVFEPGTGPAWVAGGDLLAARGFQGQMRLIDGQLAFPDEMPPETWQELRVGTAGGMVTLRRDGDRIQTVTWGNADDAMVRAWNALTWAIAETGRGKVLVPSGAITADEYRRTADLPAGLH